MNRLTFSSLFALIALLGTFSVQAQVELEQISVIKAKLMERNGALMVDVREVDELAVVAYDVENIINVPLSELEERMDEIPKDRDIIMVCRSGNRSGEVAKKLLENGYKTVVNMEGGILAWQEKEFAVIKNGKTTQKKACCAKANSKNGNLDGTCKGGDKEKACCAAKKATGDKACCAKDMGSQKSDGGNQ